MITKNDLYTMFSTDQIFSNTEVISKTYQYRGVCEQWWEDSAGNTHIIADNTQTGFIQGLCVTATDYNRTVYVHVFKDSTYSETKAETIFQLEDWAYGGYKS